MKFDYLKRLTVDILVTWRCNLRCKKCCVPKTGPEASFTQFTETLDKLYDTGIRRIILTGGDPLVREDISDIARYAKEKGFDIYLSTNGILLKERWEKLSPYISWVNISFDCPTAELDEMMTGKGGSLHFKKVLEFLNYYGKLTKKTSKIKLATVIMKKNKEYLIPLGKLIFEEQRGYRPDVWRLYQFSDQFSEDPNASNVGYSYVDENSVTLQEAEEAICLIKKTFPQINVSFRTAESRDESFIFLTPDLVLNYPSGREYIYFGDTKIMSSKDIKNALYGVNRIWGKIIKNREIYS